MAVKKTQRGFGMLEVLISTFLVIIGLLVIMSSLVAMAKSNRYSQRMDIANSLARLEMERVRNMTFDDIDSEVGNYGEYIDHPDYRHVVSVTPMGNLKQVRLQMYFENDRRRAELVTFVADL